MMVLGNAIVRGGTAVFDRVQPRPYNAPFIRGYS